MWVVGTDDWQIHVSREGDGEEDPEKAMGACRMMHRFSAEEVLAKIDEVEAASS